MSDRSDGELTESSYVKQIPITKVKALKRQAMTLKGKETLELIKEATAQILLSEGIDRASTNRIAEKAGVSIGTLYQYFSDKEEIFAELLNDLIEARRLRVRQVLDLGVMIQSVDSIISQVVDAVFEAPNPRDAELEIFLLPLLFRSQDEENAMRRFETFEGTLNPLVKALLVMKKPGLIHRDLDVAIFVMVQSLRGCFLGMAIPNANLGRQSWTKDKLKVEVRRMLTAYLDAD